MGTSDKTARIAKDTALRTTGWDDWHDVLRSGEVDQFAKCLTTAVLAGAATYTQTGVDRFARTTTPDVQELGIYFVSRVSGLVVAAQAGTLYLEESINNADWTAVSNVAVTANTPATLPWGAIAQQYYRFRYLNGATIQTSFRLYQRIGGDEPAGTRLDTAATDATSSWSIFALLRGILAKLLATVSVTITGRSSLYAGTGTAPLSGANAAAITAQACNAVVVQNDPDSTVDLMVGNALTVVPLQLAPGQSVSLPVTNTSLVFVRSNHAVTAATYNWLAV